MPSNSSVSTSSEAMTESPLTDNTDTPLGHTSLAPATRVVVPKAARLVAETLRGRILGREVPIGAHLPTAEALLEEFGVSRATLREALNALESEGLVQLRRGPGGGAIVTAPDGLAIMRSLESLLRFEGTTIEQLMEVRLVVDPLAVRLAAEEADADDLARIRGSVDRQRTREVLEAHEEWFRENLYFHWAIAAASHNPLVRVLSESLHNIVLAGGIQIDFKKSERRRSVADHAAIYECLAARDGDGAALRLQRHLERSLYLRARYSSP
jgi:GntR family transcriptional regulator, transcriptional repressor for pyruvate dehydrogenase complex